MAALENLATDPKASINITSRPVLKYLGFALLLGWHYTLWFVPEMFHGIELLADSVTISWLIMLASSALTLFAIPLILGRKRRLSSHTWLIVAVPIVLSAGTLYITLVSFTLGSALSAYVTSAILGVGSGVYWVLWGEFYAQQKLPFSIRYIGPAVAIALLASIGIGILLFVPFSSFWTAFLPLLSGFLLLKCRRSHEDKSSCIMLPASITKKSMKSVIIVCLIAFAASFACYFLIAIIPWEPLALTDLNFALGVMAGAILILLTSAISRFMQTHNGVFQVVPWLLVFIVIAMALFLTSRAQNQVSFILALAVYSTFELLLVMYFGILTTKGHVAPALAFGFSGGFVRAGIAGGNALALFYENHPELALEATPATILILISVLTVLLIPLLRQEYSIAKLTSEPPDATDLDQRLEAIAQEFNLSPREAEIMTLIAKGYTAEAIANKLVISPHTVNTHIRHTYEKISIHKRSELLNYINMQKTDY